MASHLTIMSSGAAGATSKAFGGQQAAHQNATSEPSGLFGLFAALLGNANAGQAAAAAGAAGDAKGQEAAGLDLAALFRLGLDSDFGHAAGEGDPEALAGVTDLSAQPAMPVQPKPMVDFVEALGALKASLDKGEPLDPELLEQVETALTGLAEALGLEIDSLEIPEDFTALLDGIDADQAGLAGAMTQLLAPLARSLAGAQPATEGDAVADAVTASAQLKALGDKLGALLAALEDGKVSAEKLAALGMAPGQALDPEIEAALSRFAAGLVVETPAVPEQPDLATPALKLTEPVLAGKSTESAEAPDKPAPAARTAESAPAQRPDDNGGQPAEDHTRERPEPPSRETRANAAPAAPPATDASGTPGPSADATAQQVQAARVDAAANPRIIQAGYQTSQQQLNLPQIAFELARQVQDGNTRFQIRLDPPELGRIDVRLDIDQSGQVTARLTVEKSETLDLMQRDQRGLERALAQAGLDSGKTSLEFSLKQNPFAGQQGQMGEGKGGSGADGRPGANDNGPLSGEAEETPPMVNLYRGGLMASGVNIIA